MHRNPALSARREKRPLKYPFPSGLGGGPSTRWSDERYKVWGGIGIRAKNTIEPIVA